MISEYAAHYDDSEFDICAIPRHTPSLGDDTRDAVKQEQMPDGVCVVCAQRSLCCSAKQLRSHKLKERREITLGLLMYGYV